MVCVCRKGRFLFDILTNITLKVSSTGIEIKEIAITGIFSSLIEKTSTSLRLEQLKYNELNNKPSKNQ